MKNHLIIATLFFGFIHCTPSDEVKNTSKLLGLWKLYSMEVRGADSVSWQEWKPGTQGYLLYDENRHVALHLTTAFYNSFDSAFPNFTDRIPLRALKHITNNYNYMGYYETKDSVVQHIKLSHSNPHEWGDTAYRKFYFIADTLMMVPVETMNARLRLKWLRVNSQ